MSRRNRVLIYNWLRAYDLMKSARFEDRGKPLNSKGTRRIRISRVTVGEDPVIALLLHGTEVVRWYPDGRKTCSLQGYNTPTTKACINDHSSFTIWSERGLIWVSVNGKAWPGGEQTWFEMNAQDELTEAQMLVPHLIQSRKPRPLPKSRNTAADPKPGDAFETSDGRKWICHLRDGRLVLVINLGDCARDRRLVLTDFNAPSMGLGDLERLALVHKGLKAIPRFLRSPPNA